MMRAQTFLKWMQEFGTIRKPSIAVLENVCFNGTHAIITDLERYHSIPFNVDKPFLINANFLKSLLKGKKDLLKFKFEDNTVSTYGHSLPLENIDEFPVLKSEETVKIGSIFKTDFKPAIKFCSTDELRPVMHGLYYHKDLNQFVATDAHKLVYWKAKNPMDESFIVRTPCINFLQDRMINVYRVKTDKGRWICLSAPEDQQRTLSFLELEGTYPAYNNVIPEPCNEIKVSASGFFNHVKNAMNINKHIILTLTVWEGQLMIYAEDVELGQSYKHFMACNTDAPINFQIQVFGYQIINFDNPKFFKGSSLIMDVSEHNRGILIHGEYEGLVMPVEFKHFKEDLYMEVKEVSTEPPVVNTEPPVVNTEPKNLSTEPQGEEPVVEEREYNEPEGLNDEVMEEQHASE